DITRVAQIPRVYYQSGTRAVAGQPDTSAAEGLHQRARDGEPRLRTVRGRRVRGDVHEEDLQVGAIQVGVAAQQAEGLTVIVRRRNGPRRAVNDEGARVVVQVLSDARQVCDHLDAGGGGGRKPGRSRKAS